MSDKTILNNLLGLLRDLNVERIVDEHFLKHNNDAPGSLLRGRIKEAEALLDDNRPDAVQACADMYDALKRYGFAISDVFGHDEVFTKAHHNMGIACGKEKPYEDEE